MYRTDHKGTTQEIPKESLYLDQGLIDWVKYLEKENNNHGNKK